MRIRPSVLTAFAVHLAVTLAVPVARAQAPAEGPESEVEEPAEPGAQAPPRRPATPSRPSGAPPRQDSDIEEIVVLGAESESSRDFAAGDSVTGFGAEDLAALGAQSVEDIASFTPNLEIVTSGATTPTFFIRGVGLNDFNPNSAGAVGLFQDEVQISMPALQLSTLFDVEAVNVLRGPQGKGGFRGSSAGAIKIYSRKPSGDFGGYLMSELGNYDARDFQGAVEAPIYQDLLSGRFAFRLIERDGWMKNGCGGLPPSDQRPVHERPPARTDQPPASLCGEDVAAPGLQDRNTAMISDGTSFVPAGLPDRVNSLDNWAVRGTLLFQPTLDMTWLLNVHGSKRDEPSQLGQSFGTRGDFLLADGTQVKGLLGGEDGLGYQPDEVTSALNQIQSVLLADCEPDCSTPRIEGARNSAKVKVAKDLARSLDADPYRGDFDKVGPTTNDTWGGYLQGEVVFRNGMKFTTTSGFDGYDRLVDIDLDFSPNVLFEITTDDEGWQAVQDLRLEGQLGETEAFRWEVGALASRELLEVRVDNEFGQNQTFGVSSRDYTQDLWAWGAWGSFTYDFWDDFTLDGGVRYNWEKKGLDFQLERNTVPQVEVIDQIWQDPTGGIRLTYRFREDTQAFWKYTRGWKGGHYNATSNAARAISIAEPEIIDSFEWGLRGSWLTGRLSLDASLFYYIYDNYQIFTATQDAQSPPEFVVLNANDAEIFGSEIDAVARPDYPDPIPLPAPFLNVRFSWLRSQFLDFVQIQRTVRQEGNTSETIIRELQNSGNALLNSPQFKVSLTAEQQLPLGRFGSLSFRYDGVWTDDTFFDPTEGRGIPNRDDVAFLPDNTIGQEAFWLHNVRASYRPPGGTVELALWVRNLTDQTYKTFGFDASTFNNTTIYFVGVPRTYGLSFNVYF